MNYKKAFYSKLEDCYLGAKIKDFHQNNTTKSGFSNLLKIKEQYFAHIKSYLDRELDREIEESQDVYNKLFTFFDSYLSESGTPFFTDTPIYKNIYAKVYSNTKDTSLFYKTQNLYYVKSDTLYQSLTLSDDSETFQVYFDASEYRQNADNSKTKLLFKLHSIGTKENELPTIAIKVLNQKDLLPDLNNVFKQNSNEFSEEFLKSLKDSKLKINEEDLKKIFRSYKKQSEIDFFIHKNAKAFLQEQFDLWMFSYLYKDSEIQEWNPDKIANLQKIKNIAYEIISLIADFENELKAIWLKPKFAKKVEYVFSVDMLLNQIARSANLKGVVGVGGEFERGEGATSQFKPLLPLIKEFLESILNDKGFESQIKEWQELKLIDETFDKQSLLDFCHSETLPSKTEESQKYRYLPIDTKHFTKETKYKILNSFENLESILNGELIKADNFQALNTLMPKYGGKVDLIYIDPPFNTGSDFEYRDKFQDSTWLSLMENRLELARALLSDKGSFYLHLDYNANYRGRELLNEIFGEENFVNEVIWNKGFRGTESKDKYQSAHDTIFYYSNIKKIWNQPRDKYKDEDMSRYNKEDENGKYALIKRVRTSGEIYYGKTYFNQEGKKSNDILDIPILASTDSQRLDFQTQKPEALLQRIIKASSNENSIILDYHLGSSTTLAVAQKLGRKWIGVEIGEHFYNVIIPRLKKVIAGFQSGISKECNYKGGGAFRYYELETYEEALNHCEYVLQPLSANAIENKSDYKGKDYAKCRAILDYRKSRKLIDKLSKGKSVCLDMDTESRKDFDIFHTLANLMGWKIKRLFLDSKGTELCEFDNGEIISLDTLDLHKYPKLKNLIWWE